MEAGIFVIFLIIALLIRLAAGSFDTDRVEEEIKAKGGTLISKEWSPFGKGWLGDQSDRIYKVRYFDKDGHEHEAFVKTSMFSGVYFTEDTIINYAKKEETNDEATEKENSQLKLENEKLKAELERLRNQEK